MRHPLPFLVRVAILPLGFVAVLGAQEPQRSAIDARAISPEELGRLLFWDPILSGPMDVACASCHHPDFAYADGRALALGTGAVGLGPNRMRLPGGEELIVPRNTQTVLNTAFNGVRGTRGASLNAVGTLEAAADRIDAARAPMFWDSRILSLELQALEPLKVRAEMRGDSYPEEVAVDSVLARLRGIPEYVRLFGEAFAPDGEISASRLALAIAAFQRTLVTTDSPFDRYQGGDREAMTPQQIRGMQAFGAANCTFCHNGPLLSDYSLRAEGVPEHPEVAAPDEGDGTFRFRTPSLRNVALTSPYMHNGTIETLEEVLSFYARRRSENPHVSDRPRRPIDIASGGPGAALDWDFRFLGDVPTGSIPDMVAFLEALTDNSFDRTIPARVPSGLPPGGALEAP